MTLRSDLAFALVFIACVALYFGQDWLKLEREKFAQEQAKCLTKP